MGHMIKVKATILLDGPFWVGIFERTDKEGYSVARQIFGGEPSDPEIYDYVLNHYLGLRFGAPQHFQLIVKRMNPKRVQREVRREMERFKENSRPSTHAQNYMREELEKHKKTKQQLSKAQKEAREKMQFQLKQDKRKEKQRGH
jgi:hypothetical protein